MSVGMQFDVMAAGMLNEKKTERIVVAMTPIQLKLLKKVAKFSGMKPTTFVRQLLVKHILDHHGYTGDDHGVV